MKIKGFRYLPIIMIIIGSSMLLSVVLPIVVSAARYQLFSPPELIDPTAVSGLPAPRILNSLGMPTTDFSNANAWFDAAPPLSKPIESAVKYYTISIPKVNMIDIPIEVNGADLKKNAIHYPGSALPGSYGNGVIFGHSALPQLYTKDNPLTIFNPLLKVKVGDSILVKFDGVNYVYVVKDTKEVTPDQVSVMSQRFDRMEITLITCVPLGTYWRRFVVHAELIK